MKNSLKMLVLWVVFTQGTVVSAAEVVFVTNGATRYTVSPDTGRCNPSVSQRNSSAKCPYRNGGTLKVTAGSLACIFLMKNAVAVYNTIPFCSKLAPTLSVKNGVYTVVIK